MTSRTGPSFTTRLIFNQLQRKCKAHFAEIILTLCEFGSMFLQNLMIFIIINMHIDEVPVSARVENNPTREHKSFHTRFGLDQSKDPA